MKGKKRIAVITLMAIMLIISVSIASGCMNHLEDEVIIGDFVCQVMSDNTVHLKNLSEEGKKKKYIVVPQELNGMRVDMLGYRNAIFSQGVSHWESENLEKVYIDNEYIFFHNSLFESCPNIKKYILVRKHYKNDAKFLKLGITTYMTPTYYIEEWGGDENLEYFSNGELKWRGANITYYYNYEESPNDGYYWIDDVEDRELIDYIPEDPKRDGYIFKGWFKDEECINEWDFETDKVEKFEEGKFIEFKENKLFAKWAKE